MAFEVRGAVLGSDRHLHGFNTTGSTNRAVLRSTHVLIIGAGVGGLCLAQGLRRSGISFTVFEADSMPSRAKQGCWLNIGAAGGAALYECLTPAAWALFVATGGDVGQSIGIYDERLHELVRDETGPTPGWAVDDSHAVSRAALRELLLGGIESSVQFGKQFVRYKLLPDGSVQATFSDGSVATGTVLVGADGVHSRVRRQLLPDATLLDTGRVGIMGNLKLDDERASWLPGSLSEGRNVTLSLRDCLATLVFRRRDRLGDGVSVSPDCVDGDYLVWAFVTRRSECPDDLDRLCGDALQEFVRDRTRGWHPAVSRMVAASAAHAIRSLPCRAAAPVRPWSSGPVTLLGDAIHAMPYVTGTGADVALRDASRLARMVGEIARGDADTADAIHRYETSMLEYGFEAVRRSRRNLALATSPSAVRRAIRGYCRMCGVIPALRSATFGPGHSAARRAPGWPGAVATPSGVATRPFP